MKKWIILIVAAIFLISIGIFTYGKIENNYLLKKARGYISINDFDEASKYLKQYLVKNPKSEDVSIEYVKLLISSGKKNEACEILVNAFDKPHKLRNNSLRKTIFQLHTSIFNDLSKIEDSLIAIKDYSGALMYNTRNLKCLRSGAIYQSSDITEKYHIDSTLIAEVGNRLLLYWINEQRTGIWIKTICDSIFYAFSDTAKVIMVDKCRWPETFPYSFLFYGEKYYFKNDFDAALICFRGFIAVRSYPAEPDSCNDGAVGYVRRIYIEPITAIQQFNLGIECKDRNDFESARFYWNNAYSTFEKLGNDDNCARCLALIAASYQTQMNFRKAANYYQSVREKYPNFMPEMIRTQLSMLKALLPYYGW